MKDIKDHEIKSGTLNVMRVIGIVFAFVSMFFSPVVAGDGYRWIVQKIFTLPDIGYWQMFFLIQVLSFIRSRPSFEDDSVYMTLCKSSLRIIVLLLYWLMFYIGSNVI